MRYHIDTIPVWDAAKIDGECLLCALQRRVETADRVNIRSARGSSAPDVRIQVNKKGFCQHHQRMLFKGDNRLGHALMLESHLTETRGKLNKAFNDIRRAASGNSSFLDRLSGKTPSPAKAMEAAVQELDALCSTCIVCNAIEDNISRYLHTFFHLYQNDWDSASILRRARGSASPRGAAAQTPRRAAGLPSRELSAFADLICNLETEAFDDIQGDVSWFIKKFDYRFQAEPWKDSRDAVERSVNKLRGWCVGKEPNPEEK